MVIRISNLAFIIKINQKRYIRLVSPLGSLISRLGIHPNVLTMTGFFGSTLAAIALAVGSFFLAGLLMIIGGTCDILDGYVARKSGKITRLGAFLDSTLDRYSDLFPLAGLAFYFGGGSALFQAHGAGAPKPTYPWTVLVITLAMVGSVMVSYTRARAEGLGCNCKIGFMQRPERTVLLILGCLVGSLPTIGLLLLQTMLILLALSSNITAIHRFIHVCKHLKKEETPH
jgi:CDP-diacylglycerol--glycerol-3-phosphate 3-phosphatidyltransferase